MAKVVKQKNIGKTPKAAQQAKKSPFKMYWTKTNNILLAAGLGLLVLGYILLGNGNWDSPIALNVSPVVLVLAYLVVIPLSILYYNKGAKEENDTPAEEQKTL